MYHEKESKTLPWFLQLLTGTSYLIIHLHRLKECLKVIEVAKFKSDLLKTNRDIAQQRCRILQTFVIEGVGTSSCLPTIQRSVKFYSFVESYVCLL